jgi:hypothetical protein
MDSAVSVRVISSAGPVETTGLVGLDVPAPSRSGDEFAVVFCLGVENVSVPLTGGGYNPSGCNFFSLRGQDQVDTFEVVGVVVLGVDHNFRTEVNGRGPLGRFHFGRDGLDQVGVGSALVVEDRVPRQLVGPEDFSVLQGVETDSTVNLVYPVDRQVWSKGVGGIILRKVHENILLWNLACVEGVSYKFDPLA